MQKKKGFTLIELLVVIAIIGILAAIVLVSVRKGPERAKDAAVIADVAQVRTQATLIYDDTGSYAGLCDGENTLNENNSDYPELAILEEDIVTKNGRTVTCHATTDAYCVSVNLSTGKYYCADSTGVAGKYDSNGCDGTNFDCAP